MALDRAPPPAGQHLESAIEAAQELGGTQRDHPRRGQFDGQRDSVEAPADVYHRFGVGRCELEVGLDLSCPFDEQADGVGT